MSAALEAPRQDEVLSASAIADFHRDGFCLAPGFFDPREMAAITTWTKEVTDWREAPGRHMVYYEDSLTAPGERVVQRVENFVPYHEAYGEALLKGRLARAASALLGERALLFKEKINFKLPGGDGFKPHQDIQAGWASYAPFFLTALVSIDPATLENGCLEVVSGWHDRGLIGQEWEPLGEEDMAGMDFVPAPTAPGDAIFFDCFAPHRSAANLTADPRRVLYVTYNRASDGDHRQRYYDDKRRSFPPDIERDSGDSYVFRV